MANIEFGEVPVSSKIATKHATPEEIVAIGRRLWQRVLEAKIDPSDDEKTDHLLEQVQKEFHDFNTSFPLVVRWAVQLRKFSPAALEKYLRLHATADLSSREGFLRLQAEYLVALYREDNVRHHDEKAVKAYRTAIVKQLIDEDEAFQKLQKEAEAEAAAAASVVDATRRQALYRFILSQKTKQTESDA